MAGTTMAMVMLAAALAILAPAARGLDRAEFPPDFLFGVATSAYQNRWKKTSLLSPFLSQAAATGDGGDEQAATGDDGDEQRRGGQRTAAAAQRSWRKTAAGRPAETLASPIFPRRRRKRSRRHAPPSAHLPLPRLQLFKEAYVGGDGVNHGETSTDAQNLGGEREHNDEDVEVVFVQENIDVEPNQTEPRVASAPSRSEQEKEPKRRRSAIGDVAAMMEKYMEMRAKQVEDEKGKAKAVDEFSIKKCINLLNTMYITSNEEIKAFRVFKIPENREIFLSANPEIALM